MKDFILAARFFFYSFDMHQNETLYMQNSVENVLLPLHLLGPFSFFSFWVRLLNQKALVM